MSGNIDPIDQSIILHLARNGRTTGKDLSKVLPIDEGATRLRLQRLLASEVRVKAFFDPPTVGFPLQAFLGFKVSPGSTASVLRQLADYECARYVSGVAGVFDVVSVVVARSLRDFQKFLLEDVGTVKGVEDVETSIYFHTERGHFVDLSAKLLRDLSEHPSGLDINDFRLMACVADDGRISLRDIARELAMSEMTTQRRLKRLIDNRMVTIRGVVETHTLGFPVTAVIGLKVNLGRIGIIARELATHKQISAVNTCTGRFDVTAFGMFRDNADLDLVFNDFVRSLKGLREATACIVLGQKGTKGAWFVPRTFADGQEAGTALA